MIGIHIRDHDPLHDWEIIPPPQSSNTQDGNIPRALKFGDGATLTDFLTVMHQINSHFTSHTTNGVINHVRFFVASNNIAVKEKILEQLPTSVALYGDHDRNSVEGVKLALIDWFLLSESSLIINTYGSSFSQEASRRKMIPLIRMYDHQLVYMDDIRLPFCGNMRFLQVCYDIFYMIPNIARNL